MRDFLEKGFWVVIPLEDAVGLNGLGLSPAGLVPHRDRPDRIIIDYTWSGVNVATRRLSPDSMMFGVPCSGYYNACTMLICVTVQYT